jgi:hypothetical protein
MSDGLSEAQGRHVRRRGGTRRRQQPSRLAGNAQDRRPAVSALLSAMDAD